MKLAELLEATNTHTFSHADSKGTPADVATSKHHRDDMLPLLAGFVGAAVATVAFVLDGTRHCVVLARGVHDDHLHLANTST